MENDNTLKELEQMQKNEKVIADWSYDLYVHCPHCNSYEDIQKQFDEHGMSEVIEVCETKDISEYDFEVECSECKKTFKVDKVQH